MKTFDDVKHRIELELTHAQSKADFNASKYYLWFYATTPERDGGIMVSKRRPRGWWLPVLISGSSNRIPSHWTTQCITQTLTINGTIAKLHDACKAINA